MNQVNPDATKSLYSQLLYLYSLTKLASCENQKYTRTLIERGHILFMK